MATDKAPAIFRLPPEILVHALAQAPPRACAAFAETSTVAHSVAQSSALWRDLHRAHFDDPTVPPTSTRTGSAGDTYDYAAQVKRRTRAETLLRAFAECAEPIPAAEVKILLETLLDLAYARPPAKPSVSDDGHSISLVDKVLGNIESDSLNERWLERWLSRGAGEALLAVHPTFSRSSSRTLRSATGKQTANEAATDKQTAAALVRAARIAQLASHLHVLATPSLLALASPSIRTAAKEIVYEQSNSLRDSLYGPFMNDGSGRVDFRKLEALAIVCRSNIDEARTIGWGTEQGALFDPVAPPSGWSATRSHSGGAVRTDPEGRDWAGVTLPAGWRGTYSFLHYPSWAHFNFHRGGAFVPSLTNEHEAVGDCMELRLELLPEGEWPDEIDQPDLSREALERDDGDEEEDADWDAGGASSSGGSEASAESIEDELPYFATAGASGCAGESVSGRAQASEEDSPPTSPPDKDDADEALLPASTLAALAESAQLGPLPAAPHTAASAAYPPPMLTFRPAPPPTESSSSTSTSITYPKLAFRGTSLPRLGFTGTFTNAGPPPSTTNGPNDRSIRGTVELTPEGHVRWQYVIRYAGMDQWAMNGVQVGGPGSAAGVLGVWSSADRAEEGPCGPFWYWPHRPDNAL